VLEDLVELAVGGREQRLEDVAGQDGRLVQGVQHHQRVGPLRVQHEHHPATAVLEPDVLDVPPACGNVEALVGAPEVERELHVGPGQRLPVVPAGGGVHLHLDGPVAHRVGPGQPWFYGAAARVEEQERLVK
jgi:hypothetical protein